MPFRVDKKDGKYVLYNLTKKEYTKSSFKTKASAISAAKNFIKFREKVDAKVIGNKVMPMTTKKTLTKKQLDTLAKHKEHHTAKHMTIMKKEMMNGKTFKQAHDIAMKKHGT